jgi:glutathionylspermidine synthase
LLENTPVDTLKVYIQLLKDQVKDLEYESQAIVGNPVYASVARYLFLNQTQAHAQIDRDRGEYIATHTLYAEAMSALEKNNRNRSVIVKCIEDFYFEEEDFPNFFTDAFVNFGKNSNRDNW